MNADETDLQNKLRTLGRSRPNSTGRTLIERGLSSKWEGTQSLAIKALGVWGDKWSRDQLKSFLVSERGGQLGGSMLTVSIESLALNLRAEDRGWVIEYCNHRSTDLEAYKLRRLTDRVAGLG